MTRQDTEFPEGPEVRLYPQKSERFCYGNEQGAPRLSGPSRPAFPRTGPRGRIWTWPGKAPGHLFCLSDCFLPQKQADRALCDRCPGNTPAPSPGVSPASVYSRATLGWLSQVSSAACPTAPPSGKSEYEAKEVPGPSLPASFPPPAGSFPPH